MSHQNLQKIEVSKLSHKLSAIDDEFKGYLATLSYKREFGHDKLKTFSPLDAVATFE